MDRTHEWTVTDVWRRLDRFLAAKLESVSRSQIQRWIREGRVRVNDRSGRASTSLSPGDVVVLLLPPPEPSPWVPEPMPLHVWYEDEDCAVIEKPAGVAVHPGAGRRRGTLVQALLARYPEMATMSWPQSDADVPRPGIVHRLDRDTSGLLLVARHPEAQRVLQAQFKMRRVHKVYLAMVAGHPEARKARIEAPIGRDPRQRKRMAVVAHGRPAITRYEVLRLLRDRDGRPWALLRVEPQTGRTHQIRVHLAYLGHPVAGDPLYGSSLVPPGLSRLFLHASELGFFRPADEQWIELASPLPSELATLVERLSSEE